MVMDPNFSDSVNGFKCDDDDTFLPNFDQSENLANTFKFKDDSLDLNFMNFPSPPLDPDPGFVASNSSRSSEVNSPDESDTSDDVLKYINSILMEENIEQKPSMFHDPLALQAAEKSLYDVLGEKYPSSPNQTPFYFTQNVEIPDYYIFGSYSVQSSYSNTSSSNSIDSRSVVDPGEQNHLYKVILSVDSSMSTQLVSSIFSDSQSILQFNRGVEEASKFLPANNQLLINLESYALPPKSKEGAYEVEKEERECSDNGSRGRKNHHREDYTLEEERSSKQAAVYEEEVELSEMFDQVLLFTNVKGGPDCYEVPDAQSEASKNLQQNGQPHASRGGKTRAKKQGNKEEVTIGFFPRELARMLEKLKQRTTLTGRGFESHPLDMV
ncbi:SCARECROW-like 14 [Actinidia rufa]|uniref:SCARECROW-like 14 n=1 Tax=Actinidia rufa TaxID=165716 RepID=A0A7J0DNX0_9ERIC|nr:SCARECROW-like 14 [Actinidia rufa]